jgi:hypothetical protein
MKEIVLCKPFAGLKNYTLVVQDKETNSVAPIIHFKKTSFLTDEGYIKLMENIQIGFTKGFVADTKEVTNA